ncbi:hypothetical protein E4T56_gene733 [Termitomyces sp. T112]|nr:hypothetical protein E4T56_gene733 [Termitomyces sp. T112]
MYNERNSLEHKAKALPPIPHEQKELNAASNILKNLNPAEGLFGQPAAHTLAFSTCPQTNSISSTFHTWDQPATSKPCTQRPPPCIDNNLTSRNQNLSLVMTPKNAKPITFQLESSQVAFAVLYLQDIAFNHYMVQLWFNPNNPMLSNWLAFTQEFSITKLHTSTPVVLDFLWLHSINPCIDWLSLTLYLNQDSLTNSGPVLFNVLTTSKNPKGTTDAL